MARATRGPRVSVAGAAAAAPVEGEYLDPIRRGRHSRRAEVRAIARRHVAEDPRRRLADDIAGGIETLDRELHALGRRTRVHVVDVPADNRPRGVRRDLKLDSE